jgi:hypothetical protein
MKRIFGFLIVAIGAVQIVLALALVVHIAGLPGRHNVNPLGATLASGAIFVYAGTSLVRRARVPKQVVDD